MKTTKLLLLIIILPYFNIKAQQLTDSIGNHLIIPGYEIPGNSYLEIASDSKNNIYAASRIGITKWDGNKWYQYKVYDEWNQHSLKRVAIDNNDDVWVISEGQGLIKFDNNSLKGINTQQYCYDMIALDSFMYGSSYKQLIKFNPTTLEFDIIYNDLNVTALQLHLDNRGNIWGTCMFEDKIFQLHNDSVILHTQLNGVNAANVIAFSVVDENYYALITKNYPYYELFSNGVYSNIPMPPINGNYLVSDFNFFPDSTLALTTTDGAFIYKNEFWNKIGEDNYARAICSISNDSIAITYDNDGISMGAPNTLTNYKGPALDEISYLAYYEKTLFLGSKDGYVSQWNGSELTTSGTSDPLFYGSSHLKVSPDNKLYSSGRNGVYRYYSNQWESLSKLYNLPDNEYFKCDIDSDNKLYVGTFNNGLYIADSSGIIEHYHSGNSPIFGSVGGILYDSKDRLWFGIGDIINGELYTLENNSFIKHDLSDFTGGGYPLSMIEDSKGNIWMGYTGAEDELSSLVRYDGENWDTLHYENELPWLGNTQPILDIYEDYKGNIWIASLNTYMYDGIQWHRFDKTYRLGNRSTITNTVTGDGKGNIFLGTADLGTYVLTYDDAGIIVPKAKKLQELTLYPNPTTGEVHLELKNAGESTIKVFDTQGSLIYSTKTSNINPTINLRHLTKGQYIINVVQHDYFGTSTIVIK